MREAEGDARAPGAPPGRVDIRDGGERVSHLHPDHVYQAHLSIYRFAALFCAGADVLDAGSGAGYGAAHLADAGAARVLGIDASAEAVAFSQAHFQRPNLTFERRALEEVDGLGGARFDLIFSSNVLEHVADVGRFLRAAHGLLKPEGALLVAVPPITDDRLEFLNLINRHHLNIWTPRQWAHVLSQYFADVAPHVHGVMTRAADFTTDHARFPTPLTPEDFVIEPATVDEMYEAFTLTSIFLARRPRLGSEAPPPGAPTPLVDGSYSRATGEITPEQRRRLAPWFQLHEQAAEMEGLRARVAELEAEVEAAGRARWAAAEQAAEIERLRALVAGYAEGRVMRALAWLGRAKATHRRRGR